MSFMKGKLPTKTRKLVKGLAKAEPVWYKAMEQAPPPSFPRVDAIQKITLPEDVYINKFSSKHPDSKHDDAPSKIMAKKKAYSALKKIARHQGKRPPPNPYPSPIAEIQSEEKKYVRDRFHNPMTRRYLSKLREDEAAEDQDRMIGSWGGSGAGTGVGNGRLGRGGGNSGGSFGANGIKWEG